MITLLLFGGSILLWIVLHWFNRVRRAKTNPYDRFLKDQHIEEARVENLRTFNLRVATHEAKQSGTTGTSTADRASPAPDETSL